MRRTPPIAALGPPPCADAALASIGRYSIVERIGQGGMAEIYAAVTQGEGSFRRPVVIKRLRPELTVDPNAVAQFCDEANLLAALHHPNIVAVHDFGRSQGQYFLAEEYVVGRDLGRVVERRFARGAPAAPVEVIAYVGVELLRFETGGSVPADTTAPKMARRCSGRSSAARSCRWTGCAVRCGSGCRPGRRRIDYDGGRSRSNGRGSAPRSTPDASRWSASSGTSDGTRSI